MRAWLAACGLLLGGAAFAAEITVQVLHNRFDPEVVEVAMGDTVVFQVVSETHNLSAVDPQALPAFGADGLEPGTEYRYTIAAGSAGDHYYVSDHAEGMTGAISVLSAAPAFAVDNSISAGWYNPAADGQGLLFEYVPSTNVLVAYWFTYDCAGGRQLWLIGTGNPVDGRVTMPMLEAQGGRINSSQPVTKPSWGELTVDFSSCTSATAWFDAAGDQRSGQVPLDRLYLTSLCP